jgi:ubiquinone/menaquinone biosynthesis C-methylase UbiE
MDKPERSAEEKAAAKALEFDRIANVVYAPIYPAIAARLLELAGIYSGRCLDIGCGGGHLGFAAAKHFEGELVLLDSNPHALELAEKRIHEQDRGRIRTLCADVHAMPLPPDSFGLILSRGAMWFWDKERSLREIWRILAPAGVAIIGGGYGTAELKEAVYRKMSEFNGEDWSISRKKTTDGSSPEDYALVLDQMELRHYEVIHEGSGDWLILRKGGETLSPKTPSPEAR